MYKQSPNNSRRNSTSSQDATNYKTNPLTFGLSSVVKNPLLLRYEDMPEWFSANEHIRTGYRPISKSIEKSIESLTYCHNETVNIYSHLIPAIVFLASISVSDTALLKAYPGITVSDRLLFAFELYAATICMFLSAIYHTCMNHSADCSSLAVRMDYCGIMVLTYGDFVSGLYFGFGCEPVVQKIYGTMITICVAVSAFIVLNHSYQHERYRLLRLSCFVTTGFFALAPIVHGLYLFGYEQLNKQLGLNYYLVELVTLLVAAGFYATKFPERRWPGKFDIFGSSHQIFHVLVVVATLAHLGGMKSAFDYNYTNPRCLVR